MSSSLPSTCQTSSVVICGSTLIQLQNLNLPCILQIFRDLRRVCRLCQSRIFTEGAMVRYLTFVSVRRTFFIHVVFIRLFSSEIVNLTTSFHFFQRVKMCRSGIVRHVLLPRRCCSVCLHKRTKLNFWSFSIAMRFVLEAKSFSY